MKIRNKPRVPTAGRWLDATSAWLEREHRQAEAELEFSKDNVVGPRHHWELACGSGIRSTTVGRRYSIQVTGTDIDEALIEEAGRKTCALGLGDTVKHIVADARSDTLDTRFSSISAERFIQHCCNEDIDKVIVNICKHAIPQLTKLQVLDTLWPTWAGCLPSSQVETFYQLKDAFCKNTNVNFLDALTKALDDHGWVIKRKVLFPFTMDRIAVARQLFYLDNMVLKIGMDEDSFERFCDAFEDKRHWFLVTGVRLLCEYKP